MSLENKVARLRVAFADVLTPSTSFEIAESARAGHRSRCRFQVVRDDAGALTYALWANGGPNAIVETFPDAVGAIQDVMKGVLRAVERRKVLERGLEAAHFLASVASGRVLVTLVEMLANDGDGVFAKVELMGRSKGVVVKTGSDRVEETYELRDGTTLRYHHAEGSFSNPNRAITIATMEFLRACACEIVGDGKNVSALELYCGCANHSCALATIFDRIVAVEINPSLVTAARESLEMNDIDNVEVVLADSQNVARSMMAGKFVDVQGKALSSTDFDVVLVDPPRAGLDPDTLRLVSTFDHVLYVSCGPENLLQNIRNGLSTHVVEKFIVLDHFPNTRHIEVAVYMRRRAL
ncbi:methyltransferase family protein [Ostreococcus tauri]|uniref:Methyltransferase family protein n=1 Tax=Ostreococcus tauri TaxID=70448 RepID=A0A1Y5I025_OSTTA|nr:methyltransferase family protein [Ostreococcus tauri]